MDVIERRGDHMRLALDRDEHLAINNSLAWLLRGLNPIANDEMLQRTDLPTDSMEQLLARVGASDLEREGLWLSRSELMAIESVMAGMLDGSIDLLGRDWELIGVDESRYEVVVRELRRLSAE